jgi:hypothetical protein
MDRRTIRQRWPQGQERGWCRPSGGSLGGRTPTTRRRRHEQPRPVRTGRARPPPSPPMVMAGPLISREYAHRPGRCSRGSAAHWHHEQLIMSGQFQARSEEPFFNARAEQASSPRCAPGRSPLSARNFAANAASGARLRAAWTEPAPHHYGTTIRARHLGDTPQINEGVSSPETPVQLDDHLPMVGRRSSILRSRPPPPGAVQVLRPERMRHSSTQQPAATRLVPRSLSRDLRHIGMSSQRDVALKSCCAVESGESVAGWDQRGDLRQQAWAIQEFLAQRAGESSTDTKVNPAMAWLGITPGSSAR